MKRSKPLRADPEKTREWQARSRENGREGMRSTELRRDTPRGRARRAAKPRLSEEVALVVYKRQDGKCACGCGRVIAPFPIGFHHVFPKQRWPELINVAVNVIGVAADCHANHETGMTRLPRSAVVRAEQLASDPPMRRYLENTYDCSPQTGDSQERRSARRM